MILCTTGFGKSVSADEYQVPNIVVMLADDAGWAIFLVLVIKLFRRRRWIL